MKRVLHLFEYCKVGKVAIDEAMRIRENCENALAKILPMKLKEPSCFFTTGFLNGFFYTVKTNTSKK